MKAILVLIILFSITESNVIYSQKKQKNKQENIKADTTGHQQKNETKNEGGNTKPIVNKLMGNYCPHFT